MRLLPLPALLMATTLLTSCLVSNVAESGGMGSVTIPNTNRMAIIDAAQNVFPDYGYEPGPASYPDSISFDKPASALGQLAYGSYNESTTMRVKLTMTSIPGTGDIRVSPSVYSVNDAEDAGFADPTRRTQLFALEFKPILTRIQSQAANAGPM